MYIDNYINPKPQRSLHYGKKSIGIVVKTPEELERDDVIGVFIPRLMFGLSVAEGAYEQDVSFNTDVIKNSGQKSIGATSFRSMNYIVLPIVQVGNMVSPKFVKGENVFIECCDEDIKNMYVLPYSFNEQNKRKSDRYTVLVPNFKELSEGNDMDIDNTYGLQIDTFEKLISLWTSIEDGEESGDNEKGKYYLGLNAKNGEILISDSGKRTITINTDNDSIRLMNENGCKLEMHEKQIDIYSPDIINIEADNEINIKSSKLNREHDDIKTSASTDTEETDTMEIKGSSFKSEYDTTEVNSKSYQNTTKKWVTDSPISGFTKVLTADSFSISPSAGNQPPPTSATLMNSGMFKAGNPSAASLGLVKGMPLISVLTQIAAKVDAIGAVVFVPPTCAATVAASAQQMISMNSYG